MPEGDVIMSKREKISSFEKDVLSQERKKSRLKKNKQKFFLKMKVVIVFCLIIWTVSGFILAKLMYIKPDSKEITEKIFSISDEIIEKKTLNVENNDSQILIEVEEKDSKRIVKLETDATKVTLVMNQKFELLDKNVWKAKDFCGTLFWGYLITG